MRTRRGVVGERKRGRAVDGITVGGGVKDDGNNGSEKEGHRVRGGESRRRRRLEKEEESPAGVADLQLLPGLSVPTSQTLPARKKTRSRLSAGSKQRLSGLVAMPLVSDAEEDGGGLEESGGVQDCKESERDGDYDMMREEREGHQLGEEKNKENDKSNSAKRSKGKEVETKQPGNEVRVGIHMLPGSCIIHILKLASTDEKSRNDARIAFPLVCKRWNEILKAPSDIWDHVYVEQDAGLKRSIDVHLLREWLLHRTPAVRRVTFRIPEEMGLKGTTLDNIIYYLGSKITSTWESICLDSKRMTSQILNGLDPNLPSLRHLDARDCYSSIPGHTMTTIEELPELEDLSIRFHQASNDEPFQDSNGALPASFFKLTGLKSLRLVSKNLNGIQPTIARMKNLEHLYLESLTNLTSLPLMTVHLTGITHLSLKGSASLFGSGDIQDGPIEPGTERMIWMIRSLPNLVELNLDECGIKEFPTIEGMSATTNLKKLSMNNNPDMSIKRGLASFEGLEELSMRNCNMPCLSSAVSCLSELRYLDVSSNGMVECHGLGKLTNLRTLKASDNPFPGFPKDILLIENIQNIILTGCTYLEIVASLSDVADKLPFLNKIDVRKGDKGRFQEMSKQWLAQLNDIYVNQYNRVSHVVIFD